MKTRGTLSPNYDAVTPEMRVQMRAASGLWTAFYKLAEAIKAADKWRRKG